MLLENKKDSSPLILQSHSKHSPIHTLLLSPSNLHLKTLTLEIRSRPPPPPMAATAARPREATPPPVIGRAGRYTVFITPPPAPRPADLPRTPVSAPRPAPPPMPPPAAAAAVGPPPAAAKVQVPPQQFNKPAGRRASGSMFGFLRDAVAKVQDVHSSLDEYLADWLGLDQSKYQWALDDYYEAKGVEKEGGKPKELVSKGLAV